MIFAVLSWLLMSAGLWYVVSLPLVSKWTDKLHPSAGAVVLFLGIFGVIPVVASQFNPDSIPSNATIPQLCAARSNEVSLALGADVCINLVAELHDNIQIDDGAKTITKQQASKVCRKYQASEYLCEVAASYALNRVRDEK